VAACAGATDARNKTSARHLMTDSPQFGSGMSDRPGDAGARSDSELEVGSGSFPPTALAWNSNASSRPSKTVAGQIRGPIRIANLSDHALSGISGQIEAARLSNETVIYAFGNVKRGSQCHLAIQGGNQLVSPSRVTPGRLVTLPLRTPGTRPRREVFDGPD
jgi:hypothetical protein